MLMDLHKACAERWVEQGGVTNPADIRSETDFGRGACATGACGSRTNLGHPRVDAVAPGQWGDRV